MEGWTGALRAALRLALLTPDDLRLAMALA